MKSITCPLFNPTAPKKGQAIIEWLNQLQLEMDTYGAKTKNKRCYEELQKYYAHLHTLYNKESYQGKVKEEIDGYFDAINNKKRLVALNEDADTRYYPDICKKPSSLSEDQQKLCSAAWASTNPIFYEATTKRFTELADILINIPKELKNAAANLISFLGNFRAVYTAGKAGKAADIEVEEKFCFNVLGGSAYSSGYCTSKRTLTSLVSNPNCFDHADKGDLFTDFIATFNDAILKDTLTPLKLNVTTSPFQGNTCGGIANFSTSEPGIQIFNFQQKFFTIAKEIEDILNANKPTTTLGTAAYIMPGPMSYSGWFNPKGVTTGNTIATCECLYNTAKNLKETRSMGILLPYNTEEKTYTNCMDISNASIESIDDFRKTILNNLATVFVEKSKQNGIQTLLFSFAQFSNLAYLIPLLNNYNIALDPNNHSISQIDTFSDEAYVDGLGPYFHEIVRVAALPENNIDSVLSFGGQDAHYPTPDDYTFPEATQTSNLIAGLKKFGFKGIDIDIEGDVGTSIQQSTDKMQALIRFSTQIKNAGLTIALCTDSAHLQPFQAAFSTDNFANAFTLLRIMAYWGGGVDDCNTFNQMVNRGSIEALNTLGIKTSMISIGFQDSDTYGGSNPGADAATSLLAVQNKLPTGNNKFAPSFIWLDAQESNPGRFRPYITKDSLALNGFTGTYKRFYNTFEQDFFKKFNGITNDS